MRFHVGAMVLAAMALGLTATAEAQRPGGRGRGGPGGGFGGGPGGFGTSRLSLLRIEAVQKELELVKDQLDQIKKLEDERRGPPGRGGPGGPQRRRGGERPGNTTTGLNNGSEFFVQAPQPNQGQRRQPTEEERQRFREQTEERAKQEKEKLAKILLPHQVKRLNEIYIQTAGVGALSDADVAKELDLSADQKEKISKARRESFESIRTEMRDLFQSGDREKIRAKFTELRKSTDEKVLGVLTPVQKKKFEDMKGAPFKMPENAGRRPSNT